MKIKAAKNYNYDELKQQAKIKIDSMAEAARQVYASAGTIQSAVYRAKLDEAKAFLKDDIPTEEEYPFIFNEVGIIAPDAKKVAERIVFKDREWKKMMAHIENIRIGRKQMIDNVENNVFEINGIVERTQYD